MRCILEMCQNLNLDITRYYEALDDGLAAQSLRNMKYDLETSTTSQCLRYKEISNMKCVDPVYGQYLREDKRILITKWRLSSHNLHVERGRYTSPKTPREERTCKVCPTSVEDEVHVLFYCPLYKIVRVRHRDFLATHTTLKDVLNPSCLEEAECVGDILLEIERIRDTENMY